MVRKQDEAEIRSDCIHVELGGGYWVNFTLVWDNLALERWRTVLDDILSLRMVLERVLTWHVPDADWNDLPFEKDKLLAQLDALRAERANRMVDATSTLIKGETLKALDEMKQPELQETIAQFRERVVQFEQYVSTYKTPIPVGVEQCFSIPNPLQIALGKALVQAYNASFKVPFEQVAALLAKRETPTNGNENG